MPESLQAPSKKCLVGDLKSVSRVSEARLDILIIFQAARKKRSLLGENGNMIGCPDVILGGSFNLHFPEEKKKWLEKERRRELTQGGSEAGVTRGLRSLLVFPPILFPPQKPHRPAVPTSAGMLKPRQPLHVSPSSEEEMRLSGRGMARVGPGLDRKVIY